MKTTTSNEATEYQVIVWTKSRGNISVSPAMSKAEADAEAARARPSLPRWAHVEVVPFQA